MRAQRLRRSCASRTLRCPPNAAQYLGDEVSRRLVGATARVNCLAPPGFDYRIADIGGGVRITRGLLAVLDVERTAAHAADGDDDISIFLADRGVLEAEQNDGRVTLAAGGGVLFTNARRVLTRFPATRFTMLQLPARALGQRLACAQAPLVASARTLGLMRLSWRVGPADRHGCAACGGRAAPRRSRRRGVYARRRGPRRAWPRDRLRARGGDRAGDRAAFRGTRAQPTDGRGFARLFRTIRAPGTRRARGELPPACCTRTGWSTRHGACAPILLRAWSTSRLIAAFRTCPISTAVSANASA